MGQLKEALNSYNNSINLNPNSPSPRSNRGWILIEIGEKNVVGIAFNVDIENFIGGNGNDYFYLSEKVISVNSNGGDDLIFAENDISNVIINGGEGKDILVSYKSSYSQNFENLVNHTNQGLEILSNNNTALNLANYDIFWRIGEIPNKFHQNSEIGEKINEISTKQ